MATATAGGEKLGDPLAEVTLVDTVSYSGLTAGKTCKLSCVLMDRATGVPLEIDGSFIFANVPYGKYLLVELESLPGYVLLKEPVPVEVDADEVHLSDIIVVFPVIDMILAILFFVKLGTAWFEHRKYVLRICRACHPVRLPGVHPDRSPLHLGRGRHLSGGGKCLTG